MAALPNQKKSLTNLLFIIPQPLHLTQHIHEDLFLDWFMSANMCVIV